MITITPEALREIQSSTLIFAKQMWNLEPQAIKEEYRARFAAGLLLQHAAWSKFCTTVRPFWFEPFEEGKNLTWQQSLVLYGIDKCLRGEASNRISVVSGHGIGKSALFSILILWFLFSRLDSKVACTAPSADQMYDVLWSEVRKWINKMPLPIANLYQWESSHIRMREAPQEWFARAKTSSKENTEALAGIHADWVFVGADEASGIEEPIFETMEGALTGNYIVFLAGNGTRSLGYFYDTHHKDAARWQTFSFSSMDSPRIPEKYVADIVAKYGSDSTQYAIRVEGKFPDEGSVDDKGYVQLFNEKDLNLIPYEHDWKPIGRVMGGLDASGEGQDKTVWAVKDRSRAGIVLQEDSSTPGGMALKSMTIVEKYRIDPSDFVIDAFGTGHSVAQEIALASAKQPLPWRVRPINTGEPCENERDAELYVNIRAMIYHKFMLWARAGGEIMEAPRLKDELLSIRFRRTTNGRIQIMPKTEMKKLGFPSPDMADALSMCFLRNESANDRRSFFGQEQNIASFDPHATME